MGCGVCPPSVRACSNWGSFGPNPERVVSTRSGKGEVARCWGSLETATYFIRSAMVGCICRKRRTQSAAWKAIQELQGVTPPPVKSSNAGHSRALTRSKPRSSTSRPPSGHVPKNGRNFDVPLSGKHLRMHSATGRTCPKTAHSGFQLEAMGGPRVTLPRIPLRVTVPYPRIPIERAQCYCMGQAEHCTVLFQLMRDWLPPVLE